MGAEPTGASSLFTLLIQNLNDFLKFLFSFSSVVQQRQALIFRHSINHSLFSVVRVDWMFFL